MKKIVPFMFAAALGLGVVTSAQAHVFVGVGFAGPVYPAYVPPPVYVPPPAVYYAPPPVYRAPVVVGYYGHPYYYPHYYGWHRGYGYGYGYWGR